MTASISTWLRGIFQRPAQPAARATHGGDQQEPVMIYSAANMMEADLVIALLASEGIPAFAANESLGQVYGLQVGPLAFVNVLVAAAMAETARVAIAQHLSEAVDEEGTAEDAGNNTSDEDEAFA